MRSVGCILPNMPLHGVLAAVWLFAGCTDDFNQHLAYDYLGDGVHEVRPVQTPALTDVVRVDGELGPATVGGRVLDVDGRGIWQDGAPVTLDYVVDDGVLVPLDDQGLMLLSFYHHLAGARDDVAARGWQDDMDAIFPVTAIAWIPAQMADPTGPIENALHITEQTLEVSNFSVFVLLEDANDSIPLAGHAGIARHEFAHAWFQVLMRPLFNGNRVIRDRRALNEGFADTYAILSLDDPMAIDFDGRDPRLPHTTDAYLESEDPYELASVFAAFAWDARTLSDDADRTLELTIAALQDFSDFLSFPESNETTQQFGLMLYDQYATEIDDPALCEMWLFRFPDLVGRCGR